VNLGILGPAHGDLVAFRAHCERLLFHEGVERIVYLGVDDALDAASSGWHEALGAAADDETFFDRIAAVAADDDPAALDAVLAHEARGARLGDIGDLAGDGGRRVELCDGGLVLLLDEHHRPSDDDLANALLVVHGSAPRADLRTRGTCTVVSSGPLPRNGVAVHLHLDRTRLRVRLLDLAGRSVRDIFLNPRGTVRIEVRSP
jgi:hypothetical protein